jgi:hypothetical protein
LDQGEIDWLIRVYLEHSHGNKTRDDPCEYDADKKQDPAILAPKFAIAGNLGENVSAVGGTVRHIREHREEKNSESTVERELRLRSGIRLGEIDQDDRGEDGVADQASWLPEADCVGGAFAQVRCVHARNDTAILTSSSKPACER